MSFSWLILCTFCPKCFICHFPILCRCMCTSCYTSISPSRCCQSQMTFISSIFSYGPWQGIEKKEEKKSYEQCDHATQVAWIMSDGKLYSWWSSCAANLCSEDKINLISQVCASLFIRRFSCPILLSLMHSRPHVFLVFSLPAKVLDLMECIQANKVITKAFISQFLKIKLSNIYLRKHSIALPGKFPLLLHNVDTFGIDILWSSSLRKECQVVTSAGLGARANTLCCLSQGLYFFWSSKD